MAEQFPRQFGKYVLLKSLARGGMGEIYLAASGQPGGFSKLCVIKKVITEKTEAAKVNRFLDEAKVVLRLSHANLVSTFDAGDVSGELYIAMELVEGKDLREIWNRCVRTRTRIPVDVALVVVREIARALAYVHTYGGLRLVHRDVAPPNILLSYFGEVKLTDFGLARSILKQEHTAPGVVFGRASYLAPEQARGEVADARTDVYSVGIVLWELLTGQPYLQLAGLDPVTSLSLVRNPKTEPPSARAPWIVPELDAVVMKALAADRAQRYQSAEDLRRELSDVMVRVAPRADAERVTEFLRGLYGDVVREESAERERLLTEVVPRFRGEEVTELHTPHTGIVTPEPRPPSVVATGAAGAAAPSAEPAASVEDAPVALLAGGVSAAAPRDDDAPSTDGPGAGDGEEEPTVVGAEPLPGIRASEAPKESLAVSALRARAGSQGRRPPDDSSGADAPTKVWRKNKFVQRDDAIGAQTFVGRVIDSRYRVLNRIGEGGMGTVYAAEHVEIGRKVAVKILHRIFSGEEQLVERFRREARAASKVGHPHIIDVTDFGTTEEGCAYFVMELLEGLDLADVLLNEGRLDPARAVRIAVQICQALEAAHTAGIIHRDLKPENIFLVSREGQADFAKVLDFGIARNLFGESQRLTNPGMAMGTPEYMAPEQAVGRPADRRTDVYAVGALLYEMVIGVAPFKAESPAAMLEAKRRPLPPLRDERPDLPPALDAIIVRTLSTDPDKRPQTMTQLEYELAKIAWGRPQAVADLLGLRATPARTMDAIDGPPPLEAAPAPAPEARSATPASGTARKTGKDGAGPRSVRTRTKSNARGGARGGQAKGAAVTAKARVERDASALGPGLTPPPADAPVSAIDRAASLQTPPPVTALPPLSVPDIEKLLETLSPPPEVIAPPPATPAAPPVAPAPSPLSLAPAPAPRSTPRRLPSQPSLEVGARPASTQRSSSGYLPAIANGELDPVHAQEDLRSRRGPSRAVIAVAVLLGGMGAWAGTHGGVAQLRDWMSGGDRASSGPPARLTTASVAEVVRAPAPAVAPRPNPAPAVVAIGAGGGSPPKPASAGSGAATPRTGPEIVQTPVLERARTALAGGTPDDAVAVLRPAVAGGNAEAVPVLIDALVASGWNDVKVFRWASVARKAREALALSGPAAPSRGGHALLGEALYAYGEFGPALSEFTKALAESPHDAKLKRRIIRSRRQLAGPGSAPAEPAAEQD